MSGELISTSEFITLKSIFFFSLDDSPLDQAHLPIGNLEGYIYHTS